MAYNTKVYREQGGDSLVIASGGTLTIAGTVATSGVQTLATTTKLQFRDTGLYINSGADGKLTISADGSGDDDITLSGTVTVTDKLTCSNASLPATGRLLKLSGTFAAAALTDGYGALEVDVTLSGSPTDHVAAASAWANITGGTVPPGNYVCARNDGIYEATAATITNAKLIFGARMQYLADDTDGLRFPFSLNTNNAAITALFDVNNLTDLGTVANAGATAATLLPICRDAGGTLKYVLLYDLQ